MSEPIILIPGDAPTLRFAVTTPPPDSTTDGDPFDLTDYNADFFIKRSLQDSDYAAVFHADLTSGVVVAFQVKDGILDVHIPYTVTPTLRPGRPYPWYLVISHVVQTEKVFVVERGSFLTQFPEDE